jgi:Uma2 family endonuclease
MQIRFGPMRTRRSPDIFFISNQREHIIQFAHIEGAPDLILEIISPDSQSRDRREKFHEYESAGVAEYWIVDPLSKTVEAYTLVGKKYRLIDETAGIKSKVLPGFAIKAAWLWRAKLPKIAACLREMKSIK